MTKHNRNTRDWRRTAVAVAAGVLAAAGVVATATPALAQTRQDNGRALDSNPRVGSNGRNEGGPARGGGAASGTQIITGTARARRQFRGFVPYSDPGSFRGITAGSLSTDRFVRDSAGAPTRYGSEVDLTNPT